MELGPRDYGYRALGFLGLMPCSTGMWAWVLGTLAGRAESRSGCGLGILKAALSAGGRGGGAGRKGRGVRGRRAEGRGGRGGGCCVVTHVSCLA